MKLALFDDYVPGVVNNDRIIDLSPVLGRAVMDLRPRYRMPAIIGDFDILRGRIADAATGNGKPLTEVKLRAPLPQPIKMLFGIGNYKENIVTATRPLELFLKAPSTILDPGGTVILPAAHDPFIFHHEAELGFVIGKRGKDISETDAMSHIFGYMCIIDVSARGLGDGVGFRGKNFDTFCPMGPWIVTRDEIPNPHKLSVRLWVDGELRQDYNTDDMEHPIPELVNWASRLETLEVGDVFACGTNHQGLGPLQDGETATIEVEQVGRMSVKVSDSLKRRWPVGIDRSMGAAVRLMRQTGKLPAPGEMFKTRRLS